MDVNNPDQHSIDTTTMWMTNPAYQGQIWIQYDFSKTYKLHQMLVWNYNGVVRASKFTGFGLKDVIVEYSEDGQIWNVHPENTIQFAQAPGTEGYVYNTTVNFYGVMAKSVRITAKSKWGEAMILRSGLSEVRFMYIPLQAREP